jgi:AcrR family transcriptional regulator
MTSIISDLDRKYRMPASPSSAGSRATSNPASPSRPRAAARPGAKRAGLRERNKQDKHARIVRAARDLFREQGFEATTGRQICERAGIGTGTLFLYVRDKRELLFLIFRPLAERVFSRLPTGLEPGEGVVDGLMRLFGAFFRLYGRDPRLARLFLQELFFRADPGAGMVALSSELRRRIRRIVEDGQARGELRTDADAAVLGTGFAAHYVFWLQLWIGSGEVGRRAAETGLREALVLALGGLRAREDRAGAASGAPR